MTAAVSILSVLWTIMFVLVVALRRDLNRWRDEQVVFTNKVKGVAPLLEGKEARWRRYFGSPDYSEEPLSPAEPPLVLRLQFIEKHIGIKYSHTREQPAIPAKWGVLAKGQSR